jgi:hypothetical protein
VVEADVKGKLSMVMCAGLVDSGGDGGKLKAFSAEVCGFGTGLRRRREMDGLQW